MATALAWLSVRGLSILFLTSRVRVGLDMGGGESCDDSHWVFDFGGTTNWVKLL